MKPLIPNIIFKSLLWLKQYWHETECKYLLECYTLTPDQKIIYNGINSEAIYGVVEGKVEAGV